MSECRVCKSQKVAGRWTAQEKMFGTGESFEYFECSECGCVQIEKVPEDLARHYPSNYYSQGELHLDRKPSALKKLKYEILSRFFIPARSSLGKALGYKEFFNWLGLAQVKPEHKILDFGSGAGHLLKELYEHGFKSLLGVDPFLPKNTQYAPGFEVRSQSLESLEGGFDVIMSHHSFEHVSNPVEIFAEFYKQLAPGGVLILRIPYLGWAWQHYGINWVSLDAPRHLFHITEKGIGHLSQKTGFRVEKQFWDSFEFQFWASEQYEKGISLFAETSYGRNPEQSLFSKQQIRKFRSDSQRLNAQKSGDQVCYILRKPLPDQPFKG